jgi:hypothetical protein
MDISICYCRNRECWLYGLTGKKARLKFEDWHRGALHFRCEACDKRVSARTGTAYAGIRTDEVTYRYAAPLWQKGWHCVPPDRCLDWRKILCVVGYLASASIAKM